MAKTVDDFNTNMDTHVYNQQATVKATVVGDFHVGKTSVIRRYTDNKFDNNVTATIGGACITTTVHYIDWTFTMHIWDVSGSETYRTIVPNYFRGSQVFILMYNITDKQTFDNINGWMETIKKTISGPNDKLIFVLCGNKSDLSEERQVTTDEGKKLAENLGSLFYETSAKCDFGVSPMFSAIARKLRMLKAKTSEIPKSDQDESLSLKKPPPTPKPRRRC